MSNVQTPVPENAPLMVAWTEYKQSAEFENTKKWAGHPKHVDGSLWAAFSAGFAAREEYVKELKNVIADYTDTDFGGPA